MKQEMKWISIWILANLALTLLCLTYFYLNHELAYYSTNIITVSLFFIVAPYTLWKYNQLKFVEKREIVIQFLKDA